MRWLCLLAALGCSKKPEAPPLDDEWVSHPVEQFSGKLDKDITFTIELPKGMFHDPTSNPIVGQHYGRWLPNQLEDHSAPGVAVFYAPKLPDTLDDAKKEVRAGDEIVDAAALPDGGYKLTSKRKDGHGWDVRRWVYTPSHDAVWCAAWRVDDTHTVGEPSRRMLERMCESIAFPH